MDDDDIDEQAKYLDWIVPVLTVIALLLATHYAFAGALDETRYCYANIKDIPRDTHGVIKRRADVIAAFRQFHPCPVTKLKTGACKGWAIDHVVSLAVGGCDSVSNMQWLPDQIKSCALPTCKDRFERIIYAPAFGT